MSSPVYRKLDGTVEQWEQKAQGWMMSLHVFTCNFLPESLTKVLGNFLAQAKKPVMAKFHLSCKTHKSMHLSPQGGWASRPLVGLYRWCTTSVSYLLAVGGSILLKLDRFRDPVQCVLKDTSDALARMRTTEATKFVKVSTILCVIVHYDSLDGCLPCFSILANVVCAQCRWEQHLGGRESFYGNVVPLRTEGGIRLPMCSLPFLCYAILARFDGGGMSSTHCVFSHRV